MSIRRYPWSRCLASCAIGDKALRVEGMKTKEVMIKKYSLSVSYRHMEHAKIDREEDHALL